MRFIGSNLNHSGYQPRGFNKMIVFEVWRTKHSRKNGREIRFVEDAWLLVMIWWGGAFLVTLDAILLPFSTHEGRAYFSFIISPNCNLPPSVFFYRVFKKISYFEHLRIFVGFKDELNKIFYITGCHCLLLVMVVIEWRFIHRNTMCPWQHCCKLSSQIRDVKVISQIYDSKSSKFHSPRFLGNYQMSLATHSTHNLRILTARSFVSGGKSRYTIRRGSDVISSRISAYPINVSWNSIFETTEISLGSTLAKR